MNNLQKDYNKQCRIINRILTIGLTVSIVGGFVAILTDFNIFGA